MSANFLRKSSLFAASLLAFAGVVAFMPTLQPVAMAQTNISGDIVGTVSDPQGAVVPGATVTVVSRTSGATKTVTTTGRGDFRVPLLSPGEYDVTVTAPTFETAKSLVTVSAGSTTTSNIGLTVGQNSTTVEVSAAQPLLHTEDAQISTTFSMDQIQSLPNPGNDLTFVAQTTPGVVMNTQGGYGNFSVNGLPGTSNTFTINGGYEGDPYLNLNNSGATNLLLGNNDVATVTVIANAFDAAFGGLGGAQVNEISRAGSNGFHGNATYWWNGSVLNATSFLVNNGGGQKSFDNVNQWGAGIGGPIKKDKAFFFFNTEGLRVVIPNTATATGPSPDFQAAVLNPSPLIDPALAPYGNLAANGLSAEAPLYEAMFAYYNAARNYGAGSVDPADPRAWDFLGQTTNFAKEWLITGRTDFAIGTNDHAFIHFKVDKGTQPTATSFLDPIFNAESPQPSYEGQLNETHSFSPNLTNQFLFAASYYRAIFVNTNDTALAQTIPFVLIPEGFETPGGSWDQFGNASSWVGNIDYALPQGRNVTGYQFNDDVSWTKGNHNIRAGFTMRRDDITDYTSSEHNVAFAGGENIILDEGDFAAGYTDEWAERIPQKLSEPVALYVMGAYLEDQWKAAPGLTVTFGLRAEHNANPTCLTNCVANLSAGFNDLSTDPNTAYNTLITSGRKRAFFNQQNIALEPRAGFAYLPGGPGGHTTIRGGFGMFADYFPAQIMGDLLANPPNVDRWTVLGAYFGDAVPLDPSLSGSGHQLSVASDVAFQAAFPTGGSYNSILASTGGIFRRPTITAIAPKVYLPTYEEWNLGIEHAFTPSWVLAVTYVGNHGYHEPVASLPNAYDPYGDMTGIATSLPNKSFASVTQYYSGASSNYNGLQTTVNGRMRWLSTQFNYVWSHSLDEASNGGFDAFGVNSNGQINPYRLADNYGNADYDVRHYISASYVINVPYWGGPKVLTSGWEIAGTIFHNNGYPFSNNSATGTIVYGNGALAHQLDNNFSKHCGGFSHFLGGTPCAFSAPGTSSAGFAHYDFASSYGQQERNQLFGPNYTDFDMDIAKAFKIPGWESANLKVAAQFFNLFNHTNFQIPLNDVSNGGVNGELYSTASTPTSILGAFLGGDASPRLIQLKASFNF